METTSTTSTFNPARTANTPTNASGFAGGDFETFLKMLTTQIRNQDPLNPMEGSDFAVQLATFSGVEQQVQTNDLLQKMTDQLGAEFPDNLFRMDRPQCSHDRSGLSGRRSAGHEY